VAASTLEAATHGASLVAVRYSRRSALTDIDAPQAAARPGQGTRDYSRGDADGALRTSAVVTDRNYAISRNNHNPMELPATIASWTGNQLTVWDKVQGINSAQQALASAFGVPVDNVRVISPFVGGAFGSAGRTWQHQTLAAFAARVRSASDASARVNADGTADIQSAASDMGPGTYTSMAQVAADTLGLTLARVRLTLGDSRLPKAPPHSGSRTMASVGSAVFTAATMLRDRLIRTAVVDPGSPLNGLPPQGVSVSDGRMFSTADPSRGERYGELLRRRGWPYLDAQQTWSPGDADSRFSMNAYGAVFAEVAVDESLGTVQVRRMLGIYDAGRVINPKLAHSQAIGGMVGGIGMALLEDTQTDHRDGRIVNANMSDYLVPVTPMFPCWTRSSSPARTPSRIPSARRGSARLSSSACRRPSPTRYSTRPEDASPTSRSPSTS